MCSRTRHLGHHASSTAALAPARDGWTWITWEQRELAYRYLEIMRQMNRATYSPARPERVVRRMCRLPHEYYHFAGATFELVIGFEWMKRLRQFQVKSTGFVGAIEPQEALDRIAAKARAFVVKKGLDRLIAIRPRQMDSPRIVELYELLYSHPVLDVRGGHWLTEGEYLWIRFRR